MPRAPIIVLCLGLETEHWREIIRLFPCIVNCTLVSSHLLVKERWESARGTGLDAECADPIKAKPAYPLLYNLGRVILTFYKLLIVVCKSGRHRSVALGKNIADDAKAIFLHPALQNLEISSTCHLTSSNVSFLQSCRATLQTTVTCHFQLFH